MLYLLVDPIVGQGCKLQSTCITTKSILSSYESVFFSLSLQLARPLICSTFSVLFSGILPGWGTGLRASFLGLKSKNGRAWVCKRGPEQTQGLYFVLKSKNGRAWVSRKEVLRVSHFSNSSGESLLIFCTTGSKVPYPPCLLRRDDPMPVSVWAPPSQVSLKGERREESCLKILNEMFGMVFGEEVH